LKKILLLLNYYDIVVTGVGSTHVGHHIFKKFQVIHFTFANVDSTKVILKD
jgi:hypothetical protein